MKKPRRSESDEGIQPSLSSRRDTWVTAAFVIAVAAYLALFFASCPDRLSKFLLLVVPEELVNSWLSGSQGVAPLLDRLPILAAAALILTGAYGIGRLMLWMARADRGLTWIETLVFSSGLGLNSLSLYTLAVGLCGGLRQPPFFIFPLVAGCLAAVCSPAFRRKEPADARTTNTEGWLARYGLWLAAPFVLVIVLGSMLPPWDFDVREYHLQVPKEWYLSGRISFLPHIIYGNMPLGSEMHAMVGMNLISGERNWWWGALVGKTVMGAFAPLTALTLYAAGRRMFCATAGVVAALVYISIPWVTHISVNGLNEGVSAFYWLTAFYATWLQSRSDESSSHPVCAGSRWGLLLVAGFLAGSAVSCKYPAVLFVVFPLAAWVLCERLWSGSERFVGLFARLRIASCFLFLVAAALGCGLWFAKNAVLTGNPTYPLLYSVFDGQTRTPVKDQQWRRAHAPPAFAASDAASKLGRVAWRSELLSPLVWPLAGLALVAFKSRREVLLLAGFLLFVFVAWWLFTHRIDRFWVPALPFAALLAGAGTTWSNAAIWRWSCGAFLAMGLLFSFLVVSTPAIQGAVVGDNRYFAPLETLRVDEPQKPEDVSRVNSAHRFLNRVMKEGDTVLLVGDAQPFDLEVPVLYNTCFDDCVFEVLLRNRSRAERLASLRERNITHIYISWSEIARYRSAGNYGFTDFVTRELVHDELVREQGLLRPLDCGLPAERGEIFEVLGEGL